MYKLTVAIAIAAILTGCGGSSETSSGFSNEAEVLFTLDRANGPTCYGTDDVNRYNATSYNYKSVSCYWYCAPFYGETSNAYVVIDFVSNDLTGNQWIKDSEYTSEGICND